MRKDLAWAITIGISLENQNKLTGSWVDLNKKVMKVGQTRSLLEYLPTIAEPTEYPVCKKFLDDLVSLIKELYLDHIVAHSDEQVYAHLERTTIVSRHHNINGKVPPTTCKT